MAYVKPIEVDDIPLPSNPEFVVKMKRRALFGDQRKAQTSLVKINSQTGQVSDIEWSAYIEALLPRLIVGWNLTDENERPLAITPENIDKLAAEDGLALMAEAAKRTGLGGVASSGPFVTPSATD